MNPWLEAVILGIIQGLTEFLPVSSSGHLELAKWIMGNESSASESFLMTVVLHCGTALSTVFVFRKYLWEVTKNCTKPGGWKFFLMILLSMTPAVIVGLLFEEQISAMFDGQIILVSAMLCFTGCFLIGSDYLKPRVKPLSPKLAFLMGVVQAIAIIPGISRSGSTITSGVAMGIERKKAAQFSFLMVLPLIFGKMAKDLLDGTVSMSSTKAVPLGIGFIFAFIVGIMACNWMVAIVKNAKLRYFGIYCLIIGIAAIIVRLWVFPS